MAHSERKKTLALPGPLSLARESLKIYKKRFWIIVGVFILSIFSMLGYFGSGAIIGFLVFLVLKSNWNIFSIGIVVLLGIAFVVGAFWLLNWIQAAYIVVIRDWEEKRGVRSSMKEARMFAWPLLGTTLLSWLLIFGGTLLFVIPGILLSIWFNYGIYAVVCEGKSGLLALHASRELFRGRFWQVVWRQIAVALPEIIVTIFISLFLWDNSLSPSVNGVHQLLSLLLMPFYMAYTFVLYQRLHESTGSVVSVPKAAKRIYYGVPLLGVVFFIIVIVKMLPTIRTFTKNWLEDYVGKNLIMQKVKPGTGIVYGLIQYRSEYGRYPENLTRLVESGKLQEIDSYPNTFYSYVYSVEKDGMDFRLCTPKEVTPQKCVTSKSTDFDL